MTFLMVVQLGFGALERFGSLQAGEAAPPVLVRPQVKTAWVLAVELIGELDVRHAWSRHV